MTPTQFLEAEAPSDKVEAQKSRAVVAVGRFQPPTRGHYKVMGAMKQFIRDNPQLSLAIHPIVVVVAGEKTSLDKEKNPLSADERITYMTASGEANGVKFLTAKNAFDGFMAVRRAGFEPLVVAAGSDRAPEYLRLLNSAFKERDGSAIVHRAVPGLGRDQDADQDDGDDAFDMIIRMLNDDEEVDDKQISASLARYAARNGEAKAFASIVGMSKKPKLAKKLQDKIVAAAPTEPPPPVEETE
jgi:hypothetical protein